MGRFSFGEAIFTLFRIFVNWRSIDFLENDDLTIERLRHGVKLRPLRMP